MKKRWLLSLLLVLVTLLGVCTSAHAEARIDHVTDAAGILTADERQSLNDRAAQLSEETGCGIYIVVVYDYGEYVRGGGIEYFAEEVFDSYGLGYGDTQNGILLAMSMKERDYDIYAHGNFGNYAFTDYGKEQLADTFLDNFRRNDWVGGFSDFVENSGDFLRRAQQGDPVDIWIPDEPQQQEPGLTPGKLLASVLAGLFGGGATVGGMKHGMKSAVKQTRAENYVARGGVNLYQKQDNFVNRTVTQQVIRREDYNDRPSGGHFGGTTISGSHGGSHHSGKF